MSPWLREVHAAADAWRSEAARRRALTAHDPAADVLEYAARDLIERVRPLASPTATLTARQYAAEHRVRVQTVLGWIRRGLLPAAAGPHGYEIPATTKPPTRGRRVA